MSVHRATIEWSTETDDFAYETYTRDHSWSFENGTRLDASAAPAFKGSPDRLDPEEALVAAISSCHMLTFLAIAAKKRLVVRKYRDSAIGYLEMNEEGRLAMTRVNLSPDIEFGGAKIPSEDELERLHDSAHKACFIANSVKTRVEVLSFSAST